MTEADVVVGITWTLMGLVALWRSLRPYRDRSRDMIPVRVVVVPIGPCDPLEHVVARGTDGASLVEGRPRR